MAAPSFKETLWGNGTTSIYFDYTVYGIKNQAPATGRLCQVLEQSAFYTDQQAYNQATQINQPCKGRSDGTYA